MLDDLLADLRRQDYDGEVQIVVVEETDAPRAPEGVDYVPHPVRNLGIAYARNLALEHARHALVVFVDDDCRVGPDWLLRLLAPLLEDDAVLGAQGGVRVPEGTNALGWAESLLGFPGGGVARMHRAKGQMEDTAEVSTLNAAYRKQAVLAAGGFDEAARLGGEDYLLAKRVAARGRLAYVPDAVVEHAARGSLAAIWRWFARRGRAEVALWRAGLAPAGFGAFVLRSSLLLKLAALAALAPWIGWWLPLLLPAAVAAATWWRLRWAWGEERIPKAAILLAPLVRLTMDVAADVGRLAALAAGRD